MLICLNITNIALIEKLNIEWDNKMTVLTGETGAGKSIIIDCVNLLLGARSDKTLVRYGTDKARVQGMFSATDEILSVLEEDGIDVDGDTILIDREISAEGRNICRINGVMTTQAVLKEIGTKLINIHGQQDNQALMMPEKHILFLDEYAKTDLTDYERLFEERKELLRQLDNLNRDEKDRQDKIDLLKYQIDEIEKASLKSGEEEELTEQQAFVENSEKITLSLNTAYSNLYADNSAYDKVAMAIASLEKVTGIDDRIDETLSKLNDAKYIIEDSVHEVNSILENIDFDENTLNDIEHRLDIIKRLNKKYGGSIEDVLKFLEEAKTELDNLENFEAKTAEITGKLEKITVLLQKEADKITKSRIQAAQMLQEEIEKTLSELDMPKVKFLVKLLPQDDFLPKGKETAEFMICPNVGEELKPLHKIASGGELSRVMLAIKSIVSDNVDTLIFDEIDTGVSGSAAQKIAIKLSKLGENKQVICVSHSPQLAAVADNHYVIKKAESGDRTLTSVTKLNTEERVLEIARIIDGENITETAMKHAKEMLKV